MLEAIETLRVEVPLRLTAVDTSCRGDLETVAWRAVERDPERRYESAWQLADDVERFLDDRPITARPATTFYQVRKFARRHRGLVAGVATALVALVAGTLAALQQARVARASARLATEQAELAEETKGFLLDMFRAPSELSPTTRASELLELGVERLGGLASPRSRAELAEALGVGLLAVGDYPAGAEQLELAVGLQRGLEPGSLALAGALENLADARVELDEFERSVEHYEEALGIRGRLGARTEGLNFALATPLRKLGRFEEAREALRRHAARLRSQPASAEREYQLALNDEERLLVARESRELGPAEVESGLLGVLEAFEGLGAVERHPGIFSSLARAAADRQDAQGALDYMEAHLELLLEIDPNRRRPDIGFSLRNRGAVLYELGRRQEALEPMLESLEILEATLGAESEEVARTRVALAAALFGLGRYEECVEVGEPALAHPFRDTADERHQRWLLVDNLSTAFFRVGRHEPAREAYRGAIELLRELGPDRRADLGRTLTGYADCLLTLGDGSGAEVALEEALAIRREELEPGNWRLASTEGLIGRALALQGRFAEAERVQLDALEELEAKLDPAHPRVPVAYGHLAELYELWGRPEEAEAWSQRNR